MKGKPKDPEIAGIEEQSEDAETEDDLETSDLDDQESYDSGVHDLGISCPSAVEASMCLRCIYMKCRVHLAFMFLSCVEIFSVLC